MTKPSLSAVVSVKNEERQLAECLACLKFADEIVVLLDKCTDGSKEIAQTFTDRVIEGDWAKEGERRNAAIAACAKDWVLEVDADERVPEALACEIRATIESTPFDWHEIPVDNYVGARLVRHGWGASFGKAAYPGLFKRGVKVWMDARLHPPLEWHGRKGPMLKERLIHYVDRNLSDMLKRLDSYSTARAKDLREQGETWGGTGRNVVRFLSRFFKCYVRRKGYREGGYGLMVALCAGLYPLVSHLKAKLEKE
ncbi:putative glycosyltransferase [Rhodospirillaceae bacterium LM-1]|nr:putative glycosyltransferase [Rhodospirillaceae bacterium LM-1]